MMEYTSSFGLTTIIMNTGTSTALLIMRGGGGGPVALASAVASSSSASFLGSTLLTTWENIALTDLVTCACLMGLLTVQAAYNNNNNSNAPERGGGRRRRTTLYPRITSYTTRTLLIVGNVVNLAMRPLEWLVFNNPVVNRLLLRPMKRMLNMVERSVISSNKMLFFSNFYLLFFIPIVEEILWRELLIGRQWLRWLPSSVSSSSSRTRAYISCCNLLFGLWHIAYNFSGKLVQVLNDNIYASEQQQADDDGLSLKTGWMPSSWLLFFGNQTKQKQRQQQREEARRRHLQQEGCGTVVATIGTVTFTALSSARLLTPAYTCHGLQHAILTHIIINTQAAVFSPSSQFWRPFRYAVALFSLVYRIVRNDR